MNKCVEIKSLNNNTYIYNGKYNLIIPKTIYNTKVVETIADKYFVVEQPVAKKDFLENIKFEKPRCLGLVLTDSCNFRCKYCANSDKYKYAKGYSKNVMSLEVLEAAIKMYVEKYSKAVKYDPNLSFGVMFYGGEPLLEFDLIERAVSLVTDYYKIENPIFTITTNGYLIDEKVIRFFKKYNFDVNISMDGYKEIHNKNRVTVNNKPTYDVVIDNFIRIKKELGDKVGIITTFDTQVSPKRLYEYYSKNSLIAESLRRVASVNNVNTNYYDMISSYKFYDKELNEIYAIIKKGINNNFLTQFYSNKFLGVSKRKEFYDSLYSCCSPISSKLTVSANGKLHICEKVNEKYPIGDVWMGIDYQKAYEYYANIIGIRKEWCSECVYHNICNPCFAQLNVGGTKFELDKGYCEWMKKATRDILSLYCTFLDIEEWPVK